MEGGPAILYVDTELSTDGRPLELGLVLRVARKTVMSRRVLIKWPDRPLAPIHVAGASFVRALALKIEEFGITPREASEILRDAIGTCSIMGFKSAGAELKALEQLLRFRPVRAAYFDIDGYVPRINGHVGSVGEYIRRLGLHVEEGTGAHDALWDAGATALIAEACCRFEDDGYPLVYAVAYFGKSVEGEELRVKGGALKYGNVGELGQNSCHPT